MNVTGRFAGFQWVGRALGPVWVYLWAMEQIELFEDVREQCSEDEAGVGRKQDDGIALLPPTRYQGSKRKLCPWIDSHLRQLEFETVLDAFAGTGAVSYMLKARGKKVVCNDILASNEQAALALVENDSARLGDDAVEGLLNAAARGPGKGRPTFVADTFGEIYFTDEENLWIDCMRYAIVDQLGNRYERAIAWYALFQSAIAKRPYNLFHRRNLYMRTADVPRSFGNKRTWDRPFSEHFAAFVERANGAVIDGGRSCSVVCGDAVEVEGDFDLVYIDTPYITKRGIGVDYTHFYHFLEGLLDYERWGERIDRKSKHLRMKKSPSAWTNPKLIAGAFDQLFAKFCDSTLVVSYRSDGIPPIGELVESMKRYKSRIDVHQFAGYQYALSKNRSSNEVLIVGR